MSEKSERIGDDRTRTRMEGAIPHTCSRARSRSHHLRQGPQGLQGALQVSSSYLLAKRKEI
jgi:hypothetical protein